MRTLLATFFLLTGLLAPGTARAKPNCNAVSIDELRFVGCNDSTVINPQTCEGAISDCEIAGSLLCDLSVFTSNPQPNYYCPLFPRNGVALEDKMGAPAVDSPPQEKTAEEEKRKLEAETLARQKALEEELARKAAAEISSQSSALQTADEISRTGMNEAATIGVIWCAHGANVQKENREMAEQSYGTCKQYMGAADSIREQRGRNEAYVSDPASLTGDWAHSTLDTFEKNFGLSSKELVDRLANSSNRGDDLAQITQGKLNTEELADAYTNGKAPDDEKFAVTFGSKAPPKKETLRANLKKAMAAEAKRRPASAPAVPKPLPKAAAHEIGLTPLENSFAPSESAELTIFQVVRRKYEELLKRF